MAQPDDRVKVFADWLRSSKSGLEIRTGILQGQRVEFFRGKDLAKVSEAKPEAFYQALGEKPAAADAPAGSARQGEAGASVAGEGEVSGASGGPAAPAGARGSGAAARLAARAGTLLLQHHLTIRCERAYRKPLPGTNKLVKFPKKLEAAAGGLQGSFSDKDTFYGWTYEQASGAWGVAISVLIAVAVVGACLFPLAPASVKVGVFYLSVAILTAIVAVLLLRMILATASWICIGRAVWLLPNLLDDSRPVLDLFRPLVEMVERPDDEPRWASHPATRLCVAISLFLTAHALAHHVPSGKALSTEAQRYRDELFDFLKIDNRKAIGQMAADAAAAADAAVPAPEVRPDDNPAEDDRDEGPEGFEEADL